MSDSDQIIEIVKELTYVKTRQADIKATLETLEAKVDSLNSELTKYKGFIGGVYFLGSCFVAFFSYFIKDRFFK